MKYGGWVAGSRRLYARLINIYPKDHVAEYGPAMLQVFTDQCREISQEQGIPGVVFLWLRTIIDLGKTAVSEHIHARHTGIGLPEIAPLAWTKALLVLIPGAAFLTFYIACIIWNDDPSIYAMMRWSVLLSAIPILWVWWRTKVFPVWGLVPAGMMLYLAFESIYKHTNNWLLLTAIFIILIVFLGWRYARRWHPSGKVFVWLGVCLFAILTQLVLMFFYSPQASNWSWSAVFSESMKNFYPSVWFVLEETTGLILFIVCTAIFARRFANLSVLFLLGYFFVNYFSLRVPPATADAIYPLVLAYRLFLTILCPLWIVWASSTPSRRRGITIGSILAFLILAVLDGGIFSGWLLRDLPSQDAALLIVWSVFRAASFITGFILADQLCQTAMSPLPGPLKQMRISPKTAQV
jgi:hypothetical protein